MINGLSGRPGAGKTYEAVVSHILPALKQGRKIITNIPLNVDWFVSVLGEQARDLIVLVDGGFHAYGQKRYFSKADDFLVYDTWRNDAGQGVYFFVDECHLTMPKGGTDTALKEYLSMHRHYGHDIMLLTQNFRKVDPDVRDMVQNCYFCTKLSFLGKDESYVVKVADGVSRNIITTHERHYEDKYFPAYQSHTKVQGSVQEAETVDVVKWHQRWTTKGTIICFVLAGLIIAANFSRGDKKPPETAQNQISQPAPAPVSNSQQQSQPAQPQQQNSPPNDRSKGSHPFNGVDLHIAGFYQDWDRRGNFKKILYFTVSRNGQVLSEITNADLALAGYAVEVMADCIARISYGDTFQRFVMCDSPTVAIQTGLAANME